MAAKSDVWNMTLAHLGVNERISSETLEDTELANMLHAFSTPSLNEMKRRHQWQAFSVYDDLELVAECPNKLYNFAYRYPADCLFFRKILSEIRNDDETTRVPFSRGRIRDNDNKLVSVIFTDHSEPVGLFTEKEDEDTNFDDDFAIAWSYRLAYFVAPGVTGGDPFQLQRAALSNFKAELHNAIKMDMIEQQRDPYPASKYERARHRHRHRRIDGERGFLAPNNTVIS